jgi:pimeloyl-ACP methyl ester carboxylesterase
LPRRSRQLPPERCYPAGDERVGARFVRLRSGLRVRVVEGGPAGGPPVILLPGWAASAFAFRYQLSGLVAAGYRAMAVDLKGLGFSEKPTGHGEYSFGAMLHHVEEVIDAVTREPAVLLAQSMAGPLAIEVARARGAAVSTLVLVSPVGLGVVPFIGLAQLLAGRWLDPIAPRLVRRWVVRRALGVAYGDSRRVTERIVDEYWAPSQFSGFGRALRALVHDFDWAPMPEGRLLEVADRTLVVLGGRDRLVRGSAPRARRLFGPRTMMIPDAGHALQEETPDAANAAILDFLARPRAGVA